MSGLSFFGDVLQIIAERGRRFTSFSHRQEGASADVMDVEALCETLLSSRDEASAMALAGDILKHWSELRNYRG